MLRLFPGLLVVLASLSACVAAEKNDGTAEEGFVQLFDGKSLKGWKASENEKSFSVVDGAIVANGDRSHLFYVGSDKPFVNFHFKADVMTMPKSNSGIYFHSHFQKDGWPKYGYEAQVNNTHADPRKTGSLYAVKDVMNDAPAKDNQWFTEEIVVQGKHITIKVDGKTVVDYTEPDDKRAGSDFTRKLDKGTFALQAHDPGSKVLFKNLRVKRLEEESKGK